MDELMLKGHVFYLKPIQYIGVIVLGMKPLVSPTNHMFLDPQNCCDIVLRYL
jgi:hypothetical protein